MSWVDDFLNMNEEQLVQLYTDAKALAPVRRRRPRRLSEIKKHGSWLHLCGAACAFNFAVPVVPDMTLDLIEGDEVLTEAIAGLIVQGDIRIFTKPNFGLPGFTVFLEPWQRAELLHDIDDCCLAIENEALFN